jgi:hypothetical protein
MRSKSSTERLDELDADRQAPLQLGIRSEGLARWKAPLAMKRMWSVRIMPYLW